MVERWAEGDYTLDEWDEQRGRDGELTDYVKTDSRQESVTDAYNPEAEAVTDGGVISRESGDGNGEHWQNEQTDDGTWNPDSHKPIDHTPARTIVTGFAPNSRVWRLHEDLKVSVQRDDGSWYTTPHTDADRRAEAGFLDAKVQRLGLSQTARDAVVRLVASDEKTNVWNLRHGGHDGMIVGYSAWYLNPDDRKTAKDYAREVASEYGLDADEACEAVAYAFERAEERGLGE